MTGPTPFTLASIAGYLLMVAAILLLLAIRALFGDNVIAIAVQVLAAVLMIWARVTFGRRSFHVAGSPTEGGVVTTGPYRFIRHPIYAAALYFLWAGVLSHASAGTLTLGGLAVIGVVLRVLVEERLLVERYPEYRDYAARTKRLIPFLV